jgi:hypothetical protein
MARGDVPGPVGDETPGDGTTGSSGSSGAMPGEERLDCEASAVDPGASPLRLLSRRQYMNTVRDLVGEVEGLEEALGPASEASAFGLVQPDVTQVELESFQAAADLLAAAVVSDPETLAAVAPCETPEAPVDCARAMIEDFGARAYRSPLADAADVDRHLALFGTGAETSYEYGIELLLRGMLQSPRFLYRVEIGTSRAVSERAVELSSHELAARLSYLVWESLPDAELRRAADDGSLAAPGAMADQLARMLEDPRGAPLVRRFLESFTHLGSVDGAVKDVEMFPHWQAPEFRRALQDQARSFFDHVLGEEGGRLRALLTSQALFVNGTLAEFYGADAASDAFELLQPTSGTASGLLTLPAVLALTAKPDESSPIYRGKFVREALLCQQLPAPPANVPKPPEVEPDVSTRERLSQHEVDPACSGCHRMLDPIGFGFEHYDAIGRYRTSDGGKPVDARGELWATRDIDGAFEGVVELGERLAGSEEVQECVARQWFRYAIGRFEQDVDACSMQQLLALFAASEHDLNTLPRALAETDAFRYRRPRGAEVSP